MPYASDADLVLRVPAVAGLPASVRQAALDDAAAQISETAYGDQCLRAHCMLAAHYLALDPANGLGGESAPVASMGAGAINASFAVGATVADGPNSTTAYGRQFDAIARTIPHVGEAVF